MIFGLLFVLDLSFFTSKEDSMGKQGGRYRRIDLDLALRTKQEREMMMEQVQFYLRNVCISQIVPLSIIINYNYNL